VLKIATVTLDSIDTLVTYSSSLNSDLSKLGSDGFSLVEFGAEASDSEQEEDTLKTSSTHTIYTLKIKPDDFFMFGAGFGDKDADQTPVYEKVVDYEIGDLTSKQILIPASSIKGALSHRTAFYYNKKMLEDGKDHTKTAEDNDAVKAIFGHKKETNKEDGREQGQKGKILISDCFKEDKEEHSTKTFDHVSIDRFTGGAIDGALFQEKTIAQKEVYEIEILLENGVKQEYKDAFENALKDVCSGMLALGGMTAKGHGVFCGALEENGKEIFNGECENGN